MEIHIEETGLMITTRMLLLCVLVSLPATLAKAVDTSPIDGVWTIESVLREGKLAPPGRTYMKVRRGTAWFWRS